MPRWKSTETPTFAGSPGSNRAPAVVETMELLDRNGGVMATFAKDVTGTKSFTESGVLEYIALLTQASTAAPVATVLKNTLGVTITWSRNSAGNYSGTSPSSLFASGKTALSHGSTITGTAYSVLQFVRTDVENVTLTTLSVSAVGGTADPADDLLSATMVRIEIYP